MQKIPYDSLNTYKYECMSIQAAYFKCNYNQDQFKQPILSNTCITTQKYKRNEKLTD